MINRTIFNGQVFYRIADLALLFDVSAYKMRKAIKEQNIETTRLKGFGRCVFVLEADISKINVYGEMKVLKTEFTVEPVRETKVVEIAKAKRKYKKRKPVVKKEKKVGVMKIEPVAVDMPIYKPTALLDSLKKWRLNFAQACRTEEYDEIYNTYLGDEIKIEEFTSEHDEPLKQIIATLELEFKNPTRKEELVF